MKLSITITVTRVGLLSWRADVVDDDSDGFLFLRRYALTRRLVIRKIKRAIRRELREEAWRQQSEELLA